MCYAKVDGGYRCMPPKSLLNAYRGSAHDGYEPSVANGAFWINNDEPIPHLLAIEDDAAGLRFGFDEWTLDAAEYETEVAHVGNMIARYSDAKVEDFDRRLRDAQNLLFLYRASVADPQVSVRDVMKLRGKLINANLSLGYEVRSNLRDTMDEIISFNDPFNIRVNGDPGFASMLYSASKFFPSAWNRTLESNLTLDFVSSAGESWFDKDNNQIQITEGGENFSSYPSMAAAQAAAAWNKRQYETQIEMVHELSHKFESLNPNIYKLSRSFLERRALPNQGYDLDLSGKVEDHFASDYIGTTYGNRIHAEVFSMGMETTFLGTNGSLIGLALPLHATPNSRVFIYRPDIEHRNLTLGILACLTPSFNQDNMGKPVKTVFGTHTPDDDFVLG